MMAAWGYTEGIDGTNGDQPRFTQVLNNVFREMGIFEKQSYAWFQVCVLTLAKANPLFPFTG